MPGSGRRGRILLDREVPVPGPILLHHELRSRRTQRHRAAARLRSRLITGHPNSRRSATIIVVAHPGLETIQKTGQIVCYQTWTFHLLWTRIAAKLDGHYHSCRV